VSYQLVNYHHLFFYTVNAEVFRYRGSVLGSVEVVFHFILPLLLFIPEVNNVVKFMCTPVTEWTVYFMCCVRATAGSVWSVEQSSLNGVSYSKCNKNSQ
jgi:hypothetical protein